MTANAINGAENAQNYLQLPGAVPEIVIQTPGARASVQPQPLSNPALARRSTLPAGLGLAVNGAQMNPLEGRELKPIDLDQVCAEAGIKKSEITENARKLIQVQARDYMKFLLFKAGDRPFDPADCESLAALQEQLAKSLADITSQQTLIDTPTELIMQRFDSSTSKKTNNCLFYAKVTALALAAAGTIALLFIPSDSVSSSPNGQGALEGVKILIGAVSGSAATLGSTIYSRRKEKKETSRRERAENIKTEARLAKVFAEKTRDETLEKLRGKLQEIRKKIDTSCAQRLCLDYIDATPYQESPDCEGQIKLTYQSSDLNRFELQRKVLSSLIRNRLDQNMPLIIEAMKKYIPIEDSNLQPRNLLAQFIAATGQISATKENSALDSMDIRTFQAQWRNVQNGLLERLRTIQQRTNAARPGVKVDISFLDTQSNRNNLKDFPLSALAIAPDSVKGQLAETSSLHSLASLKSEKKAEHSDDESHSSDSSGKEGKRSQPTTPVARPRSPLPAASTAAPAKGKAKQKATAKVKK